MAAKRKGLNAKQSRFVDEYPIDLNATQAVIRAGYSKRSARNQGARMLANDDIAAAIAEEQQARQERTQLTADDVIRKLIGYVDNDKEASKIRVKCLELIGKNLGMFNKLVIAGDPDSPIVAQVTRRILRGSKSD